MSAYLTWVYLTGLAPICLAGSGGCEAVHKSRYSEIFGVSVAILGIAGYVGLLLSAWLKGEVVVLLGLFVALVSVLFSGYLTWLELFVIEAICQWCVVSAILMTASFILTVSRFGQAMS